jgi:hypothetical protein
MKKYVYLNFSTKLGKTLYEIIFGKGIEFKDTITTLNALTTHFLQIAKISNFSLSKVQDSPQIVLAPHHLF